MLNSCNLIGKIAKMPYLLEDAKGQERILFDLEMERPFRNSEGEYESDIVPVEFWSGEADRLMEISKPGDYVSVRGRVTTLFEASDENSLPLVIVTAESVSYLSMRILATESRK